ncbi:MAG: EAL domain-containing protein [Solirubrobacterales bacterium]
MAGALLALSFLSEAGALGYGSTQVSIGDVAYLCLTIGAAVAAIAAAWARRDPWGWGLIGLALACSAGGDLYFQFEVDAVAGPYPSLADALYYAFYPLAIAGVLTLGRRAWRSSYSFLPLLTPLLGLATVWSWLVYDPVVGTLEGSTASRVVTIGYPTLDLLLICAVLMALATLGWRARPALLLLLGGAAIIAIADSVYAQQVANGFVGDQTVIDSLWPIGTVLMATAAWLPSRPATTSPRPASVVDLAFALAAITLALTVLIWDHFDPFDATTLVLAGLTLVAAAGRLVLLYYDADRARREALEARQGQSRIQALHTAAVEAALDSIITVDPEGRVINWNPASQRTFGYSREEAIGRDVSELIVAPVHRKFYNHAFARFVRGEAPEFVGKRFEMLGRRADETILPVEVSVTRADSDPPTFTAFIRDMAQQKHREAERDRLADMVRSAEDAMLSTNLDLTIIAWNPAAERIYGYRAGEIVGMKLERLVPPDQRDELETLAAAVSDGETVSAETTRLRKDGEIIDVSLRVYPVRDEVGKVTGYTSVARDITDRRRRERERRVNREREAWRHQVEEALDQDGLEFHRQPVLDLHSGEISHHELLLRLRANGEPVPPDKFLPHVETSPLMRRIDRWAIRRGIELAAEHPVAINLSAKSLSDAGIAATVQGALDRVGAVAGDVTFEITETAAAENLEAAHALITALRGLGCGVALDDFGTGYGSFTYLLRMPVTSLKIDMEFIRALGDEPRDQRVVRSILSVAQNFGLQTVAEGVEEEHTLKLLRFMGVDCVQGYLIGRPRAPWTTEAELAPVLALSHPA